MVNLWPRPIQKPHPPVWVPGSGSLSTWDFAAKHDHCYCFLSYFGNNLGKKVMDGFWEFVDTTGLDANPHRAGFLQLVAVGDTDAQAEQEYAEHIKYFYAKCLHIPPNTSRRRATRTSGAWSTASARAPRPAPRDAGALKDMTSRTSSTTSSSSAGARRRCATSCRAPSRSSASAT